MIAPTLNWSMIIGETREYERCNIEINRDIRRVESISQSTKGVMGDTATAKILTGD